MKELILFYTSGCHLCEVAEGVLNEASQHTPLTWEKIDIADIDALIESYGVRIPVVKNKASAQELGWPFNVDELLRFLEV